MLNREVLNCPDSLLSGNTVGIKHTLSQKLETVNKSLTMNCILSVASCILGMGKATLKSWICSHKKLKNRAEELCKEKQCNVHCIKGIKKEAFGSFVEQQLLDHLESQRAELQVVAAGLLVAPWKRIDAKTMVSLSPAARCLQIGHFMERNKLSWCKKTHKGLVNRNDTNVINDFVK